MQIDHNALTKGQTIWYRYSDSVYKASGPFTVVDFFSNHEGRHVTLSGPTPLRDVRNVSLADDDDYGLPLFYTEKPNKSE